MMEVHVNVVVSIYIFILTPLSPKVKMAKTTKFEPPAKSVTVSNLQVHATR